MLLLAMQRGEHSLGVSRAQGTAPTCILQSLSGPLAPSSARSALPARGGGGAARTEPGAAAGRPCRGGECHRCKHLSVHGNFWDATGVRDQLVPLHQRAWVLIQMGVWCGQRAATDAREDPGCV